ncbi:MAG: GHKL domain-containing protein [Butyrivibrio sp.]|nr:GHKL domain-containing protein [Butyrivibrio sp.]
MDNNYSLTGLRSRFRYNLKQLRSFEFDESIKQQKYHISMILFVGFILYSIITIWPCIKSGYPHGIVTNIAIIILFVLAILHLKFTHNHVTTLIFGAYELCLILFFHFIMEVDWTIGMDAFWLFILTMPFITDYMAGVVYGTIAACSGLILSFVCFHTKMINYLQPYGSNMTQWFTIIYIVMMMAAAVIEYELTAYQIYKKASDEKISFYQKERTQRLQRLLEIYETNEQTIRKYKHDVKHFNRVLASFIQNEEYESAANYLKEFDSMLETVTAVSFCDNKVVNELLSIYANRCQKMGFKPRFKVAVPERFPIEDPDLTSLVANALENACEAQRLIPEEKRSLQFELFYDGRKLKLFTKNPCAVETTFNNNGLPVSTREVQSGVGTAQIKAIAEKYSGVASFSQNEDIFIVKAVMTCM